MADLHSTLSQHVIRRLEDATSFKGKLKCTFDPSMPLNITDLTQPFTMSCETPSDGGLNDWWWVLIIVGGFVGLCAVGYAGLYIFVWLDGWWTKHKERRAEKKRREQLAAEEAARNDYCLNVDS